MEKWQERTELLLGGKNLKKIEDSHCLVAGLGGVGAYAAEMLVRAGLGEISIVDFDIVKASNLNRQLLALNSTIGIKKADVLEKRLLDINPYLKLHKYDKYLIDKEITELLSANDYDYVIDAIDTLSPKMYLIVECLKMETKLISSMGAGGKTNPAKIQIADFSETYNDKLARMLRKRLHKIDIYKGFKVVFSSELINKNAVKLVYDEANKKTNVGTISYMPAMFGMHMAAEVLKDIAEF
jgi:tRNA A37 threonylcarbamoyladenosine dehydratase